MVYRTFLGRFFRDTLFQNFLPILFQDKSNAVILFEHVVFGPKSRPISVFQRFRHYTVLFVRAEVETKGAFSGMVSGEEIFT